MKTKCFTTGCKNEAKFNVSKLFADRKSFKSCDKCKPDASKRPESLQHLPFFYSVTPIHKFSLFTNQFGFNMFIADTEISGGIEITETESEALVFDSSEDNIESKISYWNFQTGYSLTAKPLI